jgi:glycosyltransferase involved in cell wall biosynthesis
MKPIRGMTQSLSRRHFPPLAEAPKFQGRTAEFKRLLIRAAGWDDGRSSNDANDWLMRTMARECKRSHVTAVHSYEDCSLQQFAEAKRLGKACIYDMPIGYYPAWEQTQAKLVRRYLDWLPAGGLPSSRYVRPEQKRKEMNLADLVLVPTSFAERTVRTFDEHKMLVRVPYGVELDFWTPADTREETHRVRFIYAGQISLRKGIPLLLEAWERAALRDAELEIVGQWQLSAQKRRYLPAGVVWRPP